MSEVVLSEDAHATVTVHNGTDTVEALQSNVTQVETPEKQVEQLKKENIHLHARIRGYLTLSHILEEAKREIKQHKQLNIELQRKLDSLIHDVGINSNVDLSEASEQANPETNKMENPHVEIRPERSTKSNAHLVPIEAQNSNQYVNVGVQANLVGTETSDQLQEIRETCITNNISSLQSHPDVYMLHNKDTVTNKQTPTLYSLSDPSFVILPRSNQSISSVASLSDASLISEQNEQISVSLDSSFSSLDTSHLASAPYSLQSDGPVEERDEVSNQVKSISEALKQICNLSGHSVLAPELARLSSEAIRLEKQLKVQKTINDNLMSEYDKMKTQMNFILPDVEKQSNLLRQENEKLLRKIGQLEGHQDHPTSFRTELQSGDRLSNSNNISSNGKSVTTEISQLPTNTNTESQCENFELLQNKIKRLEEKIMQLMNVNDKWNIHCTKQNFNHEKEVDELRRRNYTLCSSLEKKENDSEYAQAELLKQFKKEKNVLELTVSQEMRRREYAEGEVSTLQLYKQDLESRIQVLEAELLVYKNHPQEHIPVKTKQEKDDMAVFNPCDMKTQIHLLRQQATMYQEDFEKERKDKEEQKSETDLLKSENIKLKQELKTCLNKCKSLKQEIHVLMTEIQKHRNFRTTQRTEQIPSLLPYAGLQQQPWLPPPGSWAWEQVARKWRCPRCTYDNEPVRTSCELCGAFKLTDHPGATATRDQPSEDIMESEHLVHRCMEECDADTTTDTKGQQ